MFPLVDFVFLEVVGRDMRRLRLVIRFDSRLRARSFLKPSVMSRAEAGPLTRKELNYTRFGTAEGEVVFTVN